MAITLGALAQALGAKIIGDPDVQIEDIADLASAGPAELSFLANPKYRQEALDSKAGAILVAEELQGCSAHQLLCPNPYLALAACAQRLHPPRRRDPGIAPGASVDPLAKIDPSAAICAGAVVEEGASVGPRTVVGPNAVVGARARLGADTLLHAGVKVLDRCVIGERCILHAGAVIGSDGFGFAPDSDGKRLKIPQIGVVVLEDDVEVGANCTIDRATFGKTLIGKGTKIDNLVQIGHNVRIGANCVIVAQSGIAGSTQVGSRVILGAQSGVGGHLTVTDDVTIAARGGATGNVRNPGVYAGVPLVPHKKWLKAAASFGSLPEIRRRLRKLEDALQTVETRLSR